MSTALKIGQVADLYDISIDTLRYYEQIGLVVPERNPENDYRIYSTGDFERLNIIRSLLDMEFSHAQIREFLSNHSLSKSLELIEEEVDKLSKQIDLLTLKRKKVESCLLSMARAIHEAPLETIMLVEQPRRPYLTIAPLPVDFRDIPLAVARRSKEIGVPIDAFHSIPCFVLETEKLNELSEYSSKNILIYSPTATYETNTAFPAGDYLSVTFSGGAGKTPAMHRRLCEYMEQNGIEALDDPIEFWRIHEYFSSDDSEYIQTLEVRVRTPDKG
ncbi:MAG: MerR family transcriptional regulator [Coriobacteriales bacterium]